MYCAASVSSPGGGRNRFAVKKRIRGSTDWHVKTSAASDSGTRGRNRPYSDSQTEGSTMKNESGDGMTGKQSNREGDDESAPVSNRALVIFFAALAAALVLGYLL